MEETTGVTLDLADVERDEAGIPTMVFEGELPATDRPTTSRRTLEVVMLWRNAVVSVGHFKRRAITAGEHLANDFWVASDALPSDRFQIVSLDGDDAVVRWCDSMALEVRQDEGEILDKDALASTGGLKNEEEQTYGYKIGLHDRVAVQVGEVTFVLQYVSPAGRVQSNLLKTIDFYFTKVLSLSFIGHAFLVVAMLLTPLAPVGLDAGLFDTENNRFTRLVLMPQDPVTTPERVFVRPDNDDGRRRHGEEGAFGKPDRPKRDAMASRDGAPTVDSHKRERDRTVVMQAGIFGVLEGMQSDAAISDIFGPGGLGRGINDALGEIRGDARGDAGGAGGMGTRNYGPGGGGKSLGIGGLGDGTRLGPRGGDNPDLTGREHQPLMPQDWGEVRAKGCLSREAVGRVLRRNHSRVRYCYEKELPRNPNLAGKVITYFVIGPTGAVQSAHASANTMGDRAVEACLLRVINQLRFPPCPSGTAHVTYPWIFDSYGR